MFFSIKKITVYFFLFFHFCSNTMPLNSFFNETGTASLQLIHLLSVIGIVLEEPTVNNVYVALKEIIPHQIGKERWNMSLPESIAHCNQEIIAICTHELDMY